VNVNGWHGTVYRCFLCFLDLVLRAEVAKSGLLASGLGLVWLVITTRTSFYCGPSIERVVMATLVVVDILIECDQLGFRYQLDEMNVNGVRSLAIYLSLSLARG